MSQKTIVYFFAIVGGIIGSFIPSLWGAGFLSFSSLILSAVGGILGVIIGLKIID